MVTGPEPIESRRRDRNNLQKQLEVLDGLDHLASRMTDQALWRDVSRRLTDWQGLLERQPVQARQILKKVECAEDSISRVKPAPRRSSRCRRGKFPKGWKAL
jgi:hypothetical protein